MAQGNRGNFQTVDLLSLATQAQVSADPSIDTSELPVMNQERRNWLESVMQSVFGQNIDPVKQMKACLSVLESKDSEDDQKNASFEVLLDLCESIDLSNDFYKIKGFPILRGFLTDSDNHFRLESAQLFALLMQNNPYCQSKALEEGYMPLLLELMEKEENSETRLKLLSAISSLLRSNPDSHAAFEQSDGFSVLLRCMLASKDQKFQTSASFMLSRVCAENATFSGYLANMGFIHSFVALLQDSRHEPSPQLREHITEILSIVLKDSELARKEAAQPTLNLVPFLRERSKVIAGREEFQEEAESIQVILELLVGVEETENSSGER